MHPTHGSAHAPTRTYSFIDDAHEEPLLARREPRQDAAGALEDRGRDDHVLGAGVDVAEAALDRPGAQGGRAAGGVGELGDLGGTAVACWSASR